MLLVKHYTAEILSILILLVLTIFDRIIFRTGPCMSRDLSDPYNRKIENLGIILGKLKYYFTALEMLIFKGKIIHKIYLN